MSVSAFSQKNAFPDFDMDGDYSPPKPAAAKTKPKSAFPDFDDDSDYAPPVPTRGRSPSPPNSSPPGSAGPRISFEDGIADVSRTSSRDGASHTSSAQQSVPGAQSLWLPRGVARSDKNMVPATFFSLHSVSAAATAVEGPTDAAAASSQSHVNRNSRQSLSGDLRPVMEMDAESQSSSDVDSDDNTAFHMLKSDKRPSARGQSLEVRDGPRGSRSRASAGAGGEGGGGDQRGRRTSMEEGRQAEAGKAAVYTQLNAKVATKKEKEFDNNKSDNSDGEGLIRKATATKKKGLSSWFGGLGKKKGEKEKEKEEENERERERERGKERERERALLAKKAMEAAQRSPGPQSHGTVATQFQAGSLPASDSSASRATVHAAASAALAAVQKNSSLGSVDSPKSPRPIASAASTPASASIKSLQQQQQQQQQDDSDRNSSPDSSPKNRRVSLSGDICLGDVASSGKDIWQQMGSMQQQRRVSPPSSNRRTSMDQQRNLPPLQMVRPRASGGFPDAGKGAQSVKGDRKQSPSDSASGSGHSPKHGGGGVPISPHSNQSHSKLPSPLPRSPVGAERVKDVVTDFIRMSFGDEFQPGGGANGRNPWQSSSGGESEQEEGKGYRQEPQTRGRRSVGRRSLDLFEHARSGVGSPQRSMWDDSPQAMKQQHNHSHSHHQGRPHRQSNLSPPEMSNHYPGRSAPASPLGESSDPLNSSGRFSVSSAFAAYSPPDLGHHHHHHQQRQHSGHSDRPLSPRSKPPSPPTTGRASISGQHVYPHSTQASPRNPFADTSDAEAGGYDLNVRSSRRGRGGRASLELQRVQQMDDHDNNSSADNNSSGGEGGRGERRRYEVKVNHRVVVNSARAAGSSSKNEHTVQVRHAGRQKQMRADDTSKRHCLGNYELDGLSSEQLARLLAKQAVGNTPADSPAGSPGQVSRQLQKQISRLSDASSSLSYEDGPEPSGMGMGAPPPSLGAQKRTTREKTGTARRAQNAFEGMFAAAKKAPGRLMGKGPRDHVLQQVYEDVAGKFALSKDELGSGQYGVIRRCMEIETGKVYACKTIKKESIRGYAEAEDIRKEVACLKMLQPHQYIVELKATFEDAKNVHLVMELCRGGDLFDRLVARGSLPEPSGAKMCRNLVEALLHCHMHRCVHRDIKPENILMVDKLSDTKVKLVDFGVATFYQRGKKITDIMGTPEYMAPEQIMGSYGPEADIWSAGVVMYVVMCGVPPFWASSRDAVKKAIVEKEVSFKYPKWMTISLECKDLIRRMLIKNPAERISASDILDHPWIQKHCSSRR